MATWITHLRLAEALLAEIPGLDEAHFAIGNVAPDSGIPDENWEHFDPPAEVTHFKPAPGSPWRCADLEFYRGWLMGVDPQRDPARYAFLLGYFFHLVTDNLWSVKIGRPTQARFAAELAADPEFWWTVKRDWYGEDFVYVRSHPGGIFWRTFLSCAYDDDYLSFLPAAAVRRNLEHIQAFYQRTDDEIEQWYLQRPGIYLSGEAIDRFVDDSAAVLLAAYLHTQKDRTAGEAGTSILEISSLRDSPISE
jgi:hypothetical protein